MFQTIDLHTVVLLIFIGLLCWAAISDFREFKIPNAIVLSLLILYPAHVLTSAAAIDWAWSLVPAAAIFIAGLILFQFGAMGGGDVKLLVAVVLWSGSENFFLVMLITVIGGVCLIPLSAFTMSLKIARQEAEERNAGGAKVAGGVLQGVRIFGSALAGMRFVHLKQHWIPYGVAIAGAGIYVAGTSLMVTG